VKINITLSSIRTAQETLSLPLLVLGDFTDDSSVASAMTLDANMNAKDVHTGTRLTITQNGSTVEALYVFNEKLQPWNYAWCR
jgi:hypothetical protein